MNREVVKATVILLSLVATVGIVASVQAQVAHTKGLPTKQRTHSTTAPRRASGRLLAEKSTSKSKQASGDAKGTASTDSDTADKDSHGSANHTPALMPGCLEEFGEGLNPHRTDLKDPALKGGVSSGQGDKQTSEKDKKGFWPVFKSAKPKQLKPITEKHTTGEKNKSSTTDITTGGAATPDKPVPSSTDKSTAPSAQTIAIEPLLPDPGLISVLKDLSRALKDSDEIAKMDNPCQKAVASVAVLALAKAVETPDLLANRIISPDEKDKLQSAMTTEAWASGDIVLSPNCHASLSVVWAKKVDGLMNVAVAGNCGCKPSPSGDKIGEFVFVANGKSAVDSGFDIQSQSNVEFWLGKLTTITADTACCKDTELTKNTDAAQSVAGLSKKSQRSTVVLKAVLTERSRNYLKYLEAFKERERLAAQKADEERIAAEEKAKVEKAKVDVTQVDSGARNQVVTATPTEGTMGQAIAKANAKRTAEIDDSSETLTQVGLLPGAISELSPDAARTMSPSQVEDPRTESVKSYPTRVPEVALANQHSAMPSYGGWDSPPPPPSSRVPSPSAQVMLPDKAVAGQFLTAAVLNHHHAGEPSVELSFNGAALVTGQDGKALYLVPEDAIPGPSLSVALPAQSQLPPHSISVLQPLLTPSTPQVPHIDQVSYMVPAGGTITIDGHNFDGVSNRNSVIIDGMWDARVLVASPVQLKADLPVSLSSGLHSVSVSTIGLRSNPGQFEVVTVDILPDPKEVAKDALSKLIVKVNGTKNQTRLRIKNHTPEIVKISKGNDIQVLTSGGPSNVIVLGVQRLRKGAYHIEAEIQ